MHFGFTDQQLAFRQAVRDFLAAECTPDHIRAAWAEDSGRSRERWKGLAELGVLAVTVPEAYGGLGLDELDLVLLLEESGRAALPEPFAETAAVVAPLLAELVRKGGRDDLEDVLSGLAAGELLVSVGLERLPFVGDADVADLLILQAGDELHLVPRSAVRVTRQQTLDHARRLFEVHWEPQPDTVVASSDEGRRMAAEAFDRGASATAAQLVGAGEQILDMSVRYAKEREQFGQPIGRFQALKHMLADVVLALTFARPAVYRAAHSIARVRPTITRDVSMAKVLAAEAAVLAADTGLQVHGAIGYTWEHDLHLWFARSHALASAWGDVDSHLALVAHALQTDPLSFDLRETAL